MSLLMLKKLGECCTTCLNISRIWMCPEPVCSIILHSERHWRIYFGKKIIRYLQKKQIGEVVRDLGLEGQYQKQGTPTMGGIIIITAIVIPTLLFAKLDNVYIILMLVSTIWLGMIGFIDDYIKVFKKNKDGLRGRFKILGQIILGATIAFVIISSPKVVVRENPEQYQSVSNEVIVKSDVKSMKTTIPFVKNHELDYEKLLNSIGIHSKWLIYLIFAAWVIFIIAGVSNGANLTDGLDGLAAGTTSVALATLAVFVYVSGNVILADYLKIMYIPQIGEMTVFIAAFTGALIGFLWYNAFPAQVFMGDTGSLTIGGIIAVIAILVRKEILLPIIAGVFMLETVSVIIQVSYFKYTKRKYGEGRRVFLMSPLHHHYQKKGVPEPKIVARFIIVAIMLGVLSVITLKIR